ncbi:MULTISPECIES: S4 domain-containing protein YaaA [Sporosarcina]|uniref:S4 domain-containing protein YaaA n=1 Tax=Sporosarcina TaxID=1569 RepID=UPI00058B42AD|nr:MULTISPECIES: S4 domain-containing protein YaaA [Sporosarcina]WJY26780.1 S4 domain-containing protein YaaA [Sporosarcina sp. 0.2-SM1T-5]
MEDLHFDTEYITLGQLLKMVNVISSGGMAKWFLSENVVYVNGEGEQRRGRKLYGGDVVMVPGAGKFKLFAAPDGTRDAH